MSLPRCLSTSSLTSVSVSRCISTRTLAASTRTTTQCTSTSFYSTFVPKNLVTLGEPVRRQNRYLQTAVHRPSSLLENAPPPPSVSGSSGNSGNTTSTLTRHSLFSTPASTSQPQSRSMPSSPLQASKSPVSAEPTSTSASKPTTATAAVTPSPSPSTPPSTSPAPARSSRLRAPRKAAMTLTPSAIAQLRELLNSPTPQLIRVGVRNRGCSGLAYHLEYTDKPGKFDEQVEQDGVKVLIDSKALFSIIGSEMDWVEDKLSARFVFKNPNIKEQCGCGESFMVGA